MQNYPVDIIELLRMAKTYMWSKKKYFNFCMLGTFSYFLLSSADFFQI